MFGIDTILLLIVSIAIFVPAQMLAKKIKLAPPVFYLILGVLFGSGGLALASDSLYLLGNANFFPNLNSYNQFALYLMFMGAGFSITLKRNKNKSENKEEKKGNVTKLSTIPVYFETAALAISLIILSMIPATNIGLTPIEIAVICCSLGMASPANVIPMTMEHIQAGRLGRNGIANDMVLASVLDNSTPLPYFIPILVIALGSTMNIPLNPILLVAVAAVALVLFLVVGAGIGLLAGKIFLPLAEKYENDKKLIFVALAIYLVLAVGTIILLQINGVNAAMGLFGIFVAMLSGAGVNTLASPALSQKIRLELTKLFAMFGTPIVFTTVGSQINLTIFRDVRLIALLVLIVFLSVFYKAIATKFVLKKEDGYLDGDIKYAISCFVPKGITLVNFSVILSPMLAGTDSQLIPTMILLASITILITIPTGVTLMSNKGKEWLS